MKENVPTQANTPGRQTSETPERYMDEAQFLENFDIESEMDIIEYLIQKFLTDRQLMLGNIKDSLDAGDFNSAAEHAHTLKGVVGNFRSSTLSKQIENIEELCKEKNKSQAIQELESYDQSLVILEGELIEFLNRLRKAS